MKLEHSGRSGRLLYSHQPHCHPDWELIYNLQGTGTMDINATQYPFAPGSILLCPPGAVHFKSARDGFEDCYLRISGWELPPKVYTLEDDHDGRIGQLMRILNLTWHETDTDAVCQDLLRAITGLLQPAILGSTGDKYVQLLRHRIIERFTDPDLQLQYIQKDIPINSDYLRRLFCREQGMTPHEYLTKLRLDHACHLLQYESVGVAEAAFRSGFYDPLYFSRVFRKQIGVAPSRWKEQRRTYG